MVSSNVKSNSNNNNKTSTFASNNATTKSTTTTTTTRSELWKLIRNGRTFLTALEEFANINFPSDDDDDNDEDEEAQDVKIEKKSSSQRQSNNKNVNTTMNDPGDTETEDDDNDNDDNDNDNNNKIGKNPSNINGNGGKASTTTTATAAERNNPSKSDAQAATTAAASSSTKKKKKPQVLQYCANTGRLVDRFGSVFVASVRVASSFPGVEPTRIRNGIKDVLNGTSPTPRYLNFYFRYSDDDSSPFPIFPIPSADGSGSGSGNNKKNKKRSLTDLHHGYDNSRQMKRQRSLNRGVLQYSSTTGEFEARYETLAEAARALVVSHPDMSEQLSKTRIRAIVNGQLKPCFGHYFRFAGDTSPMPRFPMSDNPKENVVVVHTIGRQSDRMVFVYCSRSGRFLGKYSSVRKATKAMSEAEPWRTGTSKLCFSTICKILKRDLGKMSYKGLYFRYSNDVSPMPTFPIPDSEWPYIHDGKDREQDNVEDGNEQQGKGTKAGNTVTLQHRYVETTYDDGLQHAPRKVTAYCANTGKFLGQFKSVVSAVKGLSHLVPENTPDLNASWIHQILKGNSASPSYRGFYFRNSSDTSPLPTFPIPLSQRQRGQKPRKRMGGGNDEEQEGDQSQEDDNDNDGEGGNGDGVDGDDPEDIKNNEESQEGRFKHDEFFDSNENIDTGSLEDPQQSQMYKGDNKLKTDETEIDTEDKETELGHDDPDLGVI